MTQVAIAFVTVAVLALGSTARADDAEDAAATWVESVGGNVFRDEKANGKPVIKVSFGPANKVTDDGLRLATSRTSRTSAACLATSPTRDET